jgi:hypothetical protein
MVRLLLPVPALWYCRRLLLHQQLRVQFLLLFLNLLLNLPLILHLLLLTHLLLLLVQLLLLAGAQSLHGCREVPQPGCHP